jgi:sugar-specific transcriptional regulator TrmB
MNELINFLKKYNFTEKEAKIYLTCLKLKSANIWTISRISEEKRSTVYSVIKELKNKWFINEIWKNKVASYSAVSPKNILAKLEDSTSNFKEMIPMFTMFTDNLWYAPKIQFFEGIDWLEEIYNDTLQSQTDIYCLIWTTKFSKNISKYIEKSFLPNKINNNISSKVIVSENEDNSRYIKENLKTLKNLNRDRKIIHWLSFPENTMINMYWPNKILISVFSEQEPFWLIINSNYLYKMFNSIFNFIRNLKS